MPHTLSDLLLRCFSHDAAERIGSAEALEMLLLMRDPAEIAVERAEEIVEMPVKTMPVKTMECKFEDVPMEDRMHDFFATHCQRSGQDQVCKLELLLKAQGASTWLDMQAQYLTAIGMERGVSLCRNFLVFLGEGYMGSAFCNLECRWAMMYGCKIIGVFEKDSHHGAADYSIERQRAPADLKWMFAEVEYIEFHRREPYQSTMVDDIFRRAGIDTAIVAAALSPSPSPKVGGGARRMSPTSATVAALAAGCDYHCFISKHDDFADRATLIASTLRDASYSIWFSNWRSAMGGPSTKRPWRTGSAAQPRCCCC